MVLFRKYSRLNLGIFKTWLRAKDQKWQYIKIGNEETGHQSKPVLNYNLHERKRWLSDYILKMSNEFPAKNVRKREAWLTGWVVGLLRSESLQAVLRGWQTQFLEVFAVRLSRQASWLWSAKCPHGRNNPTHARKITQSSAWRKKQCRHSATCSIERIQNSFHKDYPELEREFAFDVGVYENKQKMSACLANPFSKSEGWK